MAVKSRNSKDGRPYRVVELFSGIGAQHMALERSGVPYEIVGICDINADAVKAYEAIHGPAPMLGETTDPKGRRIGDVTRIEHLPKDVDILTYSFPCFVGDTLIRTLRGDIPIRNVAAGDKVLSHDGRWHTVTRAWKSGHKEVAAFTVAYGREVVCTPNHRFWVRREYEGKEAWVPAEESVGSWVAVCRDRYVGLSGPGLESYPDGDWIWTPLKGMEPRGTEDVYDLEVEGTHSFTANGVVVHNCTDLSQANRMGKGLKGEHSGLIWAVGDILTQAEKDGRLPRYLVMENVPQVFSAKNSGDWSAWMSFLSTLGYTSVSGTLNAKDFPGTGQNRNCAFMISHLGADCPLLPQAPGGDTVLGDVLEKKVDASYYMTNNRVKGMEASSKKERAKGNGFRFKPLDPSTDVSHAVTTKEGGRKTSNFIRDPGACHRVGTVDGLKGYDCMKRVYGKDGVSPTIMAAAGGNHPAKVLDRSDVRKLTSKEAWRLQSFGRRREDGTWDDSAYEKAKAAGMSETALYQQAGNSINVNVFEAIVRSIDRCDSGTGGKGARQRSIDGYASKNAKAKSNGNAKKVVGNPGSRYPTTSRATQTSYGVRTTRAAKATLRSPTNKTSSKSGYKTSPPKKGTTKSKDGKKTGGGR